MQFPNAKADSWNNVMIIFESSDGGKQRLKGQHNQLPNSSNKDKNIFQKYEIYHLELPLMKLRKLYWCNKCQEEFKNAESLRLHIETHNLMGKSVTNSTKSITMDPKPSKIYTLKQKPVILFECKVCKETFSTKFSLMKHMFNHENNEEFLACGICFKGFSDKYNLDKHIRRHQEIRPRTLSEVKPFKCEICMKKFSTQGGIQLHIRGVMKNGRYHKCPVCVFGFLTTGSLETHKTYYCLDKTSQAFTSLPKSRDPFFCEICRKFIPSKIYFDSHQSIHSNKNPYGCKICGHIFMNRNKLKIHQKRVTGKSPYFECNFCNLKFCYRKDFNSHKMSHYASGPPEKFKMPQIAFQKTTFKSAPLKTYERKKTEKFKMPQIAFQQTTFKNAPLKTYERKTTRTIIDGINFQDNNFLRGDLKTIERNKKEGELIRSNEIVTSLNTKPESEIQDKEDKNIVQEEKMFEKNSESGYFILFSVKEEPLDPLDLTGNEDSSLFPSIESEMFDPLDLNYQTEGCVVKVEFEE